MWWALPNVVGVADDQLEVSLEFRVHRFPVDPGTLHRHQGAAGRLQPVSHLPQLQARGAVGAGLLAGPRASPAVVQAGNHRRLMPVQAGTTLNNCFHLLLLDGGNRLRRATYSDSTPRAPVAGGDKGQYP